MSDSLMVSRGGIEEGDILEVRGEVVELIPVQAEILLHAGDVRVALPSALARQSTGRREEEETRTMFVWSRYLNMYPRNPIVRKHKSSRHT